MIRYGLRVSILVLAMVLLVASAEAACTLMWDRPTLNNNGTPLSGSEPLTYRLYRSSTHLGYTLGSWFTTTTATSILCSSVISGAGPWYITVTAVKDVNGRESVLANELSPPGAPTGIGAK